MGSFCCSNFNYFLIIIKIICLSLVFTVSSSQTTTSFRPKALVIPVTKDTSTSHIQYTTTIRQRTPLVPVNLTVDLGGDFLWVACGRLNGFTSTTYRNARCRSAQCNLAGSKVCGNCTDGPPRPDCNLDTCILFPHNPISGSTTGGELASDVVSVQSTDGFNPGRPALARNVLFACGFGISDLAPGSTGVAGLGRKDIGFPSQLAAAFSFRRRFAVCLSSGTGVIFFGESPYVLLPNHDVSQGLTQTPLLLNPVSREGSYIGLESSSEYFIGVTSIKVGGVTVPRLNSTLLTIDRTTGAGGTKISTSQPYLSMKTSIYNAVVGAFTRSISTAAKRVTAVPPFAACYEARSLVATRLGAAVPQIDLVLQSQEVVWSIFGANSMVDVGNDVLCLGVVDGGESTWTSIVIGGHVIEDHLLQFDLASSRLGFSSSLLGRRTTCANFNFTSTA